MKIYDISLTISKDLPVWQGDERISLERVKRIEEGANSNVSVLKCGVHIGTHVDAPVHFISGEKGIEHLSLDVLIGPARVVQLPETCDLITAEVLESLGVLLPERMLLKTRNSEFWRKGLTEFRPDYVGISPDGAQYLVDKGARLVGVDYLSVAPFKKTRPTHEIFLKAGVILLEGANLCEVAPGDYQLICLPIKLGGSDGAPARAVLISE